MKITHGHSSLRPQGDRISRRSRQDLVPPLHHRARSTRWSSLTLVACLLLIGCGEGAKLVQATDRGGVVIYPYKEQLGPMATKFRSEALQVVQEQCKSGYMIVREGEAKGRSRVVENQGIPEVVTERRWGIEFQCK